MYMKTKKHLLFLIGMMAILSVLCVNSHADAKNAKKPKSITLYSSGKKLGSSQTMYVGSTIKIKAKIKPAKATQKVSFVSTNKKVATVSKNGKIKAKKAGKTTITVRSKKKSSVVKRLKIVVKKKKTTSTSVATKQPTTTVLPGITPTPAATPLPVVTALPTTTPAPSSGQEDLSNEHGGYLFAYFTDRSKSIHFALSADGYYYTPLNGNKPVVTPTLGRQAVRDPYILKGQDGEYYMLATDLKGGDKNTELKVNSDNSYLWGANTSIITWHSSDLITWDRETKIDILGEFDNTKDANQSRVWAPEAIFDAEKGQYMVYWSMQGGSEYGSDLMTWYAYTEDFVSLTTEPKVLYNPGATGLNLKPAEGSKNQDAIDANIIENDGKYYLFYRWSDGDNTGTMLAVADSLTGEYLPLNYDKNSTEQQTPGDLCGSAHVEGGDVYYCEETKRWILMADHNWDGYYGLSESEDLIHWTDVDNCQVNFSIGDKNPKHGAAIAISRKEYNALYQAWQGDSQDGTAQVDVNSSQEALQELTIPGASIIKESIDTENHVITKYISRSNSTIKNLEKAALEYSAASGYKVSGLKGLYNLINGASISITSLTDASDSTTWTIKGVMCNNPAIAGLYADPDIDVFNGKYYIYPTTDGNAHWAATEFHAFSSDDLVDWKDEGIILDVKNGDVPWADTDGCYAWAPSIEEKTGKYYFYFCARDKATDQQAIGVAIGDSPTGPFAAQDTPLMTKEKCEELGGSLSQAIDPSIFTDEDSNVSYMLFGNGSSGSIVELNDDMISLKEDTLYTYPSECFKNFMEAVSVFKKDGKYHFTWSCYGTDSQKYCVRYAVADRLIPEKNEDGSWKSFQTEDRGVILSKDPDNDILGTGHHSILKVPDTNQWYIAYARFGTPLSNYSKEEKGTHREICIDKMSFDSDGYLKIVKPTLNGITKPVKIKKDISIHDPSVYHDPVTGDYYTFGSHLLAAKSSDLMNWSMTAASEAGYNEGNLLFTKYYKEEFAEVYAYTMPDGAEENAWAPDIIYNKAMKKYCMYISIVDGGQKCCIAMATADAADGPYSYEGMIVCSGINYKKVNNENIDIDDIEKSNVAEALGITEEEAANSKYASLSYNCPDAIDATVFYDHDDNLWMVYGSFTTLGGIRLLKLDPETGLRGENYEDSEPNESNALGTSDPYYGLKIAANYGEGSYIQEVKCDQSPTGYYYYLWYSQGVLTSKGSYNMRLFRAEQVEGPYLDAAGTDAISRMNRQNLGIRVMDDYRFSFMDVAYTSCGGNSATIDDEGRTFIQFHQKYADETERHNVRTHQTFINEDGWLVTAPLEYAGEKIDSNYNQSQVVGEYEFIYHRLKYNSNKYDPIESENITLNTDGTITGAYNGSWELSGHYITLKIKEEEEEKEYKGVVLEQFKDGENVMVFTAVGNDNRSVWGVMK